jgi:hypothetical protein
VASKPSPSRTEFVVTGPARQRDRIVDRLGDLGSVEQVKGQSDFVLVRLRDAGQDPRKAWEHAQAALGEDTRIQPVLVDADGKPQYPTGEVSVRFRGPVSDDDLERFAAKHHLRVVRRNEFVPEQIVFEPVESARYLPDVIDELGASDAARLAWANTIAKYERSKS